MDQLAAIMTVSDRTKSIEEIIRMLNLQGGKCCLIEGVYRPTKHFIPDKIIAQYNGFDVLQELGMRFMGRTCLILKSHPRLWTYNGLAR